ncbi:MAG: bifunctional DNA-formamidopyrimidine glycosylase/DNA-(apurinic or apyrimidinic site) lyase [Lactobacillaceae bacterium]|jgi:formamidopyrimidine-DNA glycosylase|nr:bifunctional DNA-formamidopyrimidine glycosylase/DNA-(apurinic or apyrimidinic site) lyase [Lactobacillaceae bacterium]
MPELPEVESVRRGLEKLVSGRTITDIDLIYPRLVNGDAHQFFDSVMNQTIMEFSRRGKFLYIRLSNNLTIISHLRMEGRYSVEDQNQSPHKHTELILKLDDGQQIFYDDTRKFGRMELSKTGLEAQTVKSIGSMGPEPTKRTLKSEYFFNKLQSSKKEIKPWLLDQNNVAGVGNIYADEVLWLSKIHPETPTNHLTFEQSENLKNNIIEELSYAIKKGGSTVHSFTSSDGKTGQMQNYLHAYGRKGQACERCGTPLVKIKVAQRGTTFCPFCQQLQ